MVSGGKGCQQGQPEDLNYQFDRRPIPQAVSVISGLSHHLRPRLVGKRHQPHQELLALVRLGFSLNYLGHGFVESMDLRLLQIPNH